MPIYHTTLQNINVKEVQRYAGLAKTNFAETEIHQACQEVRILSSPMASWEEYDYHSCTGEIGSTEIYIEGQKIRDYLQSAKKLIFLAATVDESVETAITNYFQQGNYTYALLLDAAATAAVETVADELTKMLQYNYARQGYQLLRRYSPGYGDWPIAFQPQMIKLSHADQIQVTLTESLMLMPRKSVTAVIGLTPNAGSVIKKPLDCQQCTKLNCLARKENNYDSTI